MIIYEIFIIYNTLIRIYVQNIFTRVEHITNVYYASHILTNDHAGQWYYSHTHTIGYIN